jgi:hypothetical protein
LVVMVEYDDCEGSITKHLKVACIKVEHDDWLGNLEIWILKLERFFHIG